MSRCGMSSVVVFVYFIPSGRVNGCFGAIVLRRRLDGIGIGKVDFFLP